jgi:hypothetical protein
MLGVSVLFLGLAVPFVVAIPATDFEVGNLGSGLRDQSLGVFVVEFRAGLTLYLSMA